jgi:hypothetical protein
MLTVQQRATRPAASLPDGRNRAAVNPRLHAIGADDAHATSASVIENVCMALPTRMEFKDAGHVQMKYCCCRPTEIY